MEILKEINITKDKNLAIWLNIISLPTFSCFLIFLLTWFKDSTHYY